jgi:hypothetical protein
MNTLKSITVVWNDGQSDRTFEVDIDKDCALFWGASGWEVLEKHYKHVHVDAKKEGDVRRRACALASPKDSGGTSALTPTAQAVFALKQPGCIPTQSS